MHIRRTPRITTALVVGSVAALTAAPAAAAVADTDPSRGMVAVAVDVLRDGSGPFTPRDEPGGDSGDANGIVRTMDAVTYRVTMTSTGGPSTNERFTITAPAGTSWSAVPAACTGPGSTIGHGELTCNLGTVQGGQAVAVPVVLDIGGGLRHGDEVALSVTGTADAVPDGPVTAHSAATTVSAAPRYNLSKNVHASRMTPGLTGPDGTTEGVQLVYPVAVDWQPVVAGQGLLGFEASTGPMTFTDDLSEILGDMPSDAVLWNGGQAVCGPNEATAWRLSGLPGGVGGGDRAVTDSGRFDCSQTAPGEDVTVTITDTVTDPTHVPTKNLSGGPVVGGVKPYFVSGYISLWMPTPPPGTSVESVNRFTALQTTSVSGATNFPGGSEPVGDNTAHRNIVEFGRGTAGKSLSRLRDDDVTVAEGSAKRGDPWTTAGMRLRSTVSAANDGLAPFRGVVLCDTFDRATQRLTRVGPAHAAAATTGLTGSRIEYAAATMTSPAAGRQQTCDDADGPWYDQPEDVPGGIGAVGAMRATGSVAGGATGALTSFVTTRDAADGTRALDFGHVWFGDRGPGWVHDTSPDPALGAGPLADSVLITEDLARVVKKIVDPGHDAADTPDATSSVVPGNTVDYALYPTFTNGHATGRPGAVTVRDVLPRHTTYVPGSASPTPTVDTVTDADGAEHQRLTWDLTDVRPNVRIEPLRYTAAVSGTAPAGPVTNTVTVSSPSDRSDEQYRSAVRALQVVTSGGVRVEKTATDPVVVSGDQLRWALHTTNTDTVPIRDVDLIDVLPHRGDTRGSSFHGTVRLAGPVAVDPSAGETVTYTSTAPERVELDGDAASNQAGGATRWCTEDDLGTRGCPSALGDVTAFRVQRTAAIEVGRTVVHDVALATDGEHDGDRYTNRFGLRASNLALPVQSNPASVSVVAGAIGDRVWSDEDGNGLQDDGEPGVPYLPVVLTGTDDHGASIERATTTDRDGGYLFDGLRPGSYTVRFTAPEDRTFTAPHVGTDRDIDSDARADGSTDPVTIGVVRADDDRLEGVDRDRSVDAGIAPEDLGDPEDLVDPIDPAGPGTPDAAGTGGTTAPDGGSGRGLAFTGAEGLQLGLASAVVLLTLGLGLVALRRRRARQD